MKTGLLSVSGIGERLSFVSSESFCTPAADRRVQNPGRSRLMRPAPIWLAALVAGVALFLGPAPTEAAPVSHADMRTPSSAYRLGAADSISVRVMNFPELSTEATVTPDGKVSLPLLGPVYVSGETTSELARLLTEKWSKFVIQPSVSIEISHMRPQFVTFYGFTARTGATDLAPGMRIVEALASVGGAPNGDLAHVSITHKNGDQETVDISHPETRGGTPADIALASDDIIFVPARSSQIDLLGQVAKPGSFDFHDNMTVLDAITQDGGVKDTADLENATLIRHGKDAPLNLKALLQDHDLSVNVSLEPGDAISIPIRSTQLGVLGEVGKPGSYDYREGMTVLDALAVAGGITNSADVDGATLIHNGVSSKLDLRGLLKNGNLALNVKLQPGDCISVPLRNAQFNVLGLVGHAGSFPFRDDMTVLDALTAAGGLTEGADLNAATLERDGQEQKLDLTALLRRGDLSANMKLKSGDRIMVPALTNRNYIFGAVQRPGFFFVQAGDRLLDVVNGAGGAVKEANLADVHIIRVDKEKNTAVVQHVNIANFLTKGDMKGNIALQPGDIVFVPDKKQHLGLSDIFGVLSSLNFVTNTVHVLTGGL